MMFKNAFGHETYSKYNDLFDIGADPKTSELVGHRMLEEPWTEAYPKMKASDAVSLVKTHDRPEDDGKAIYVTRDGRSACVSFHRYLESFLPEDAPRLPMADVIAGFVRYGSWSSHLDGWQPLDRPNTLCLKFEDLLASPGEQIAKIAEFTGLQPVHEWHNDFHAAQQVNPRFFRQGSADRAQADIQGEDLDLFWLIHGDWMRRLGYGGPHDQLPRPALRRRIEVRQTTAEKAEYERDYMRKAVEDRSLEVHQLQASLHTRMQDLQAVTDRLTHEAIEAAAARAKAEELVGVAQERDAARQEAVAARARAEQSKADIEFWRTRSEGFEKTLRFINNLRWYERIYDTLARIAKGFIVDHASGDPRRQRRRERPLPRITVVTPVYNCAGYIRETIESVLSQNYPNLEYIICDGGSTDGTMDIIREYEGRVAKIVSEKDGGMYDAIAKGFEMSSGEILCYINSDDTFEPGGLLRVGRYFRSHRFAKVIYHEDTVAFFNWKFPNNRQPPAIDRLSLMTGHVLFQDGVFFRRKAYFKCGGLNRKMRLAGDWDLWVRMSKRFRFRRLEPHNSMFRFREGQITSNMGPYLAEIDKERATTYRHELHGFGRLRQLPGRYAARVYNIIAGGLKRRRLFYPLRVSGVEGHPPAPRIAPPVIPDQPRCPLTGARPDRLLFSSPDARFGDPMVNHVYYNSASDVAIVYPPLTKEQLNDLYEKYYSSPATQVTPPDPKYSSPYANYFGGRPWDRMILRRSPPEKAAKTIEWNDSTCNELLANTPGIPNTGPAAQEVNFLDVGCFEGGLLTSVAARAGWRGHGLEPNAKAVEVARGKGHRVWRGFAEDAPFVIPESLAFDVIYLGQTIEHLLDPVLVVRRLAGMLAPGGLIVMSTPNLNAKQIELFGPTWAHWHVPYHRHIFSKKSLRALGKLAGLEMVSSRTYSHPYWTCLSVQLNKLGLAAVVPHAVDFGPEITTPAAQITGWSKTLWDWRGKGDYLFVAFRKAGEPLGSTRLRDRHHSRESRNGHNGQAHARASEPAPGRLAGERVDELTRK